MAQDGSAGAVMLVARACVASDAEKAFLKADAPYRAAFRDLLLRAGYAPARADVAASMGLDFESQETVDRDYGGNWRHALA